MIDPSMTPPDAYWSVPPQSVIEALGSSGAGLSEALARQRLAQRGPHPASPRAQASAARLLLAQVRSPIVILLIVAALLSLILGQTADALIILAIIVASGMLGFWQEYRAAIAVEHLLGLIKIKATVLRDGLPREIALDEVVDGDIALLDAGTAIPGDGIILEGNDLHVDEAALTGESFPAEKRAGPVTADAPLAERCNAVFFGTHVVSGSAKALMVRTGGDTVFGSISHKLQRLPPPTEFENGVRRFGYVLLEVAVTMAMVIFAINVALHRPVFETLLFTLALTVGLTPQLLPAIISVTLARGALRMADKQVIVRRLTSIEDLGGISVLCTDKTGTLTEGRVTLHAALGVDGEASDKVRLYAQVNASFETGFTNPIDEALRAMPAPGVARFRKLDEVPYDFVRRRLSVLAADGDGAVLITKGALANVLEVCTQAERGSGARCPLSEVRAQVLERFESLSRDGFRCMGLAYKPADPAAAVDRDSERELIFAGLLTFADPPKADAVETLAVLQGLGIALKLITGDNRHVAAHIGAAVGMDRTALLTGSDLHQMTDAALVRSVRGTQIFAEVDPNQKERVIRALRKSGLAVGFLGDGINDAAALHAADVGISVDTAVDVTKQAADIVLLRKDLSVLAEGVREGRRAFANTLKYVYITTSANFGNMFSMAGASLFTGFLPLLPKQILLLNLLSDLPSAAIAADGLDPELVAQPRRWDVRAIQKFMFIFGLISSAFDYLTFGALLWIDVSPGEFQTAWFIESLLSEILILLVIRTRRAFYRSVPGKGLIAASIAVITLGFAAPYLPYADAMGFVALPGSVIGIVGLILLGYVATTELAKRTLLSRAHL
jgi:Mg2+-importing ATPase